MTLHAPVNFCAGFGRGHRATRHLLDLFELVDELSVEMYKIRALGANILQVVLQNSKAVFLFTQFIFYFLGSIRRFEGGDPLLYCYIKKEKAKKKHI